MLATKGHPNRLGIRGWVGGGRWGLDRYLYSLHRLTGLGLLAYFVLHVVVTSSRALGQAEWEATMTRVTGPLFLLGEYLVFAAFVFHGLNGLRLLFAELGLGIGHPLEPIYPYETCLHRQRPLALGVLALAAALLIVGALDFFVWH